MFGENNDTQRDGGGIRMPKNDPSRLYCQLNLHDMMY